MEATASGRDDEFASLPDIADEVGLDRSDLLEVKREAVELSFGSVTLLRWGGAGPEVVLLHGGGPNADTWDLVALHLGRPRVAIDLPGHGHSSWHPDRDYGPIVNAESVATARVRDVPSGLTVIRLAAQRPELVRRAMIVDITPGSGQAHQGLTTKQRGATALIAGPRVFETLEEIVERAVKASPRRPASAGRRGVVHNTRQRDDGRWVWRYDDLISDGPLDYWPLWEDLASTTTPMTLVKGGDRDFVTPDDLAEFVCCRPAEIKWVPGGGHSVQSDSPRELSALTRADSVCDVHIWPPPRRCHHVTSGRRGRQNDRMHR